MHCVVPFFSPSEQKDEVRCLITFYYSVIKFQNKQMQLSCLSLFSMWFMLKIFFPNCWEWHSTHCLPSRSVSFCLQTLIPTSPQPAPPIPSSSVFFSWALIFALRVGIPLLHLSGSRLFSFSKRHADVTFQLYLAYFILRRTHCFTRNIYSF